MHACLQQIVLNNLIATRDRLRPMALERGVKLTFMPFFLKVRCGKTEKRKKKKKKRRRKAKSLKGRKTDFRLR